jgi:hypothetical protein
VWNCAAWRGAQVWTRTLLDRSSHVYDVMGLLGFRSNFYSLLLFLIKASLGSHVVLDMELKGYNFPIQFWAKKIIFINLQLDTL